MKKLITIILIAGLLFLSLQFFGIKTTDLQALFPENKSELQQMIPEGVTGVFAGIKQEIGQLLGTEKSNEDIARSDVGEIHLEGEIKGIQSSPRAIKIKLHMNDNHAQKVDNPILIAPKAVFKIRDKAATFRSLKIGDIVGIILNKKGKARSVTVYNRQK